MFFFQPHGGHMNTRRFVQGFHRWKVAFSIIVGVLVMFEVARVIARFEMIGLAGYLSPFVLNIAVVITCLAVIGFTWLGQKKAPLFMALVVAYNFFTTSIVNYSDVGAISMAPEKIFGMPVFLFYCYLFVQLILVVALVAYYFTDYLFGEDTPRSEQRVLAFDEYLKKQSEEKKKAEDSDIWKD